jgi:hypothetical protein
VTGFFNLVLKPFENGHAYGGLIFISLITGGVMLLLFKLTSNQSAMKEIKTRISAFFLEMRLYKDDFSAVVGTQGRILKANLGYMKLALIPAVVMIVPVILIMVQLNLRYAHRSLAPGHTAMVKVELSEGADVMSSGLVLRTGRGVDKVSPAVRIPSLHEVDWKIELKERGIHDLTLSASAGEFTMPIFGSDRLVPVFYQFRKSSLVETIFNPGAPRIPAGIPVESVEIKYPGMSFDWGLFNLSWLWSFLIISMAFGVIIKFVFKVE